jgi:alanine-synthesizing transaminase
LPLVQELDLVHYGDQYVRIALIENEKRIRQAAKNIKKYLKSLEK